MNRNLVISTKTLIFAFAIGLLLVLLYQIKDVIILLFISLILALSIEPLVKRISKNKVPRWAAVTLVFTLVLAVVVIFSTVAMPLVISQTTKLIENLPNLLDATVKSPELKDSLTKSISEFTIAYEEVYTVTLGIIANAFSIFSVLIFTLYLSMDLPNVKKRFLGLFSEDLKDHIEDTVHDIESSLGNWVKGQLLLMIIVGVVSYIGLRVLNVPYALSLALIAGLLEVVPVLGPIIATIIASIVAFAAGPVTGVLVLALFIIIQQLENNLLVPRIMQHVIGFNPLVTMIALLIGAKLLGVVGALISLPVALIIIIIVHKVISLDLES